MLGLLKAESLTGWGFRLLGGAGFEDLGWPDRVSTWTLTFRSETRGS